MSQTIATVEAELRGQGFSHVESAAFETMLRAEGLRDWEGFAESWNDLGIDTYMADGGRYRRRRHAAFSVGESFIRRKPHQPHYQSRDYNELNGGLERWFQPILPQIGEHPALLAILRTSHTIFSTCTAQPMRPDAWHVELHQFRIEARPGELGQPTPEGLHRDGVDWVLVLLIRRENVASGETSIHDLQKRRIGSFTLATPMQAALVDDGRAYHGVTAIEPLRAGAPAYRDVLVATFRRE